MRYKLIAPVQEKSTFAQVLLNRGVQREDISKFTTTTIKDVSKPELFGTEKMKAAVEMVARHISAHDKTIIIVDPDVDGNTSSAVLLNYLYNFFPEWTESVKFYFHEGKQHGLNDCIDYIIENEYKFVLCPDAGSNDTSECQRLQKNGIDILILDHHDFDKENPYALIINNQAGYGDYPNHALSGVGVVWQFCRYFDQVMGTEYADKYLDLVAVGLNNIGLTYLFR